MVHVVKPSQSTHIHIVNVDAESLTGKKTTPAISIIDYKQQKVKVKSLYLLQYCLYEFWPAASIRQSYTWQLISIDMHYTTIQLLQ